MNGHSLAAVLGTRLSPLLEGLGPPRARPRPGPGGSRPRRTNSARTTSRPVTRISRRTGEPPPTPHRVLGRGGRSCPLEPHPSPGAAGTPAVQETRICLPRQDATTMSGPEGPGDCHVIRYEGAQPGRPSGPGHLPRPRTGTRTRPSHHGPGRRQPRMIPTRSSPASVPTAAKL